MRNAFRFMSGIAIIGASVTYSWVSYSSNQASGVFGDHGRFSFAIAGSCSNQTCEDKGTVYICSLATNRNCDNHVGSCTSEICN